jgi:alpha-tubulin suppressor-like RCC1 family protein
VFCFGNNRFNQLGLISENNKDELNLLTNIKEPILNKNLVNIKSIKMGFKHTIFISSEGEIFGCGDNSKGALGININNNFSVLKNFEIKTKILSIIKLNELWNISDETSKDIIKIVSGWNNTILLTSNSYISLI